MSASRCRSVTGAWLARALFLVALVALGVAPGPALALAPAAATGAATSAPPLASIVLPALGPGYAVTSSGQTDIARIVGDWPNPSAIAIALYKAGAASAYERSWQDANGLNGVLIVLLRFDSAGEAQAFSTAADRSIVSSTAVSSGALPSVRAARQTTYVNSAGLGEAVVERAGDYVALLSFLSATAKNGGPITAADAQRVASAQDAALVRLPGGSTPRADGGGTSATDLTWAVLAVGVMAAGLATPLVLRWRREREALSKS